ENRNLTCSDRRRWCRCCWGSVIDLQRRDFDHSRDRVNYTVKRIRNNVFANALIEAQPIVDNSLFNGGVPRRLNTAPVDKRVSSQRYFDIHVDVCCPGKTYRLRITILIKRSARGCSICLNAAGLRGENLVKDVLIVATAYHRLKTVSRNTVPVRCAGRV